MKKRELLVLLCVAVVLASCSSTSDTIFDPTPYCQEGVEYVYDCGEVVRTATDTGLVFHKDGVQTNCAEFSADCTQLSHYTCADPYACHSHDEEGAHTRDDELQGSQTVFCSDIDTSSCSSEGVVCGAVDMEGSCATPSCEQTVYMLFESGCAACANSSVKSFVLADDPQAVCFY